ILKKTLHINDDTTSKCQFIYENKEHFPIKTMCELLNVSSSGYYKFSKNFTSPQKYKRKQIEELVKDIYFEHNGNIGSPLITDIMNKDEYLASQATVARILRENTTRWHKTYTQFHDNKDVQLHFNNKDSIYDLSTKSFFHGAYAQKEIKNLYNSYSMTNFKMHNKGNIKRINSFSAKDNLIIQGDNLIALNKLKQSFKQQIKLIYIDVPYNTERNDLSYRDNYSRHLYLLMLKNRIEISRQLLKNNGSIFIHCDDKEQAYIKVLCDEIFGEKNFINQIVWKRKNGQQNRGRIATTKEYIIVYAKHRRYSMFNQTTNPSHSIDNYRFSGQQGQFRIDKIQNKKYGPHTYEVTSPSGVSMTSNWNCSKKKFIQLEKENLIYWSKNNVPYKKSYFDNRRTRILNDLWSDTNYYGSTREASSELKRHVGENHFTFPKPEKLLREIIKSATNKGDIVLDFYAGSGTTLSVAQKLHRQFIGVEIIKENFELVIHRLEKNQIDLSLSQSFVTCTLKQ